MRGRFLRITEGGGHKQKSIIVPASGLVDFKRVANEMVKSSDELPTKDKPAEDDNSVGNR